MLKLLFKDRRHDGIWLVNTEITFGSDSSSTVHIDSPLAPKHWCVIESTGDKVKLVPVCTEPALFFNGKPLIQPCDLKHDDQLRLGNSEFSIVNPSLQRNEKPSAKTIDSTWALETEASWLDKNRFEVQGTLLIGRDPGCDIHLPLPQLSRRHAELTVKNGDLYIRDLNSSNGTKVNNSRVAQQQLKHGDKVSLDVVRFEVIGTGSPMELEDTGDETILRATPTELKKKFTEQAKSAPPAPAKKAPEPVKIKPAKPTSPGNRDQQKTGSWSAFQVASWLILGAATLALLYVITSI